MKQSEFRYKAYKTAVQRIIYIISSRHTESLSGLARSLCVTRQYVNEWMAKSEVPVEYAGKIGRMFGFDPRLMCYGNYVLMFGSSAISFTDIVNDNFSDDEAKYILRGTYLKTLKKYIILKDKEIGCDTTNKRN